MTRRQAVKRLLAAGFMTLGLPRLLQAMSRMPAGRSIYRLEGDVRVNDLPARLDTIIKAGDTIVTGAESLVIFIVGSDAYLLREKSRLELGGESNLVSFFRLVNGALLSVFGKGQQREVHTAQLIGGIRGTGLYLEARGDATYACTCYGTVELRSTRNLQLVETVTTRHHDAPRLLRDTPQGPVIEKAKVVNHTDAELILIESLVGREPPFVGLDLSGYGH